MNDLGAIGLVLALLLGSMLALSAGGARAGASAETLRKVLHAQMGLVTLAFPWLFSAAWPVLVLACVCAAWFVLVRISSRLEAAFGAVLHATRRDSLGEIWFVAGVCAAFLLSAGEPLAYCIAILILAFADAAAALVGRRLGRPRRMPGGASKSLAGSAAFFALAFAIVLSGLYLVAGLPLGFALGKALAVAALTTSLEAIMGRGLDNLFVPLGALAALGPLP